MNENKKKIDEEIRVIKDQDETLENDQLESVEGGANEDLELCDNGGKFTCRKVFNAGLNTQ